uniref:Uncharacterized protein n=1 Tax=Aegilops tauschii subsp. strangulata TaxID=200361 RepID=A0A453FRC9_AEGTS
WYRALECGDFWFPAQVYNREQDGHVGFLLSCYDAHLRYDRRTDTFTARYPPHGRKPAKEEEGVQWCRVRAAPLSTPAQDLHASGCLEDLRPGDHFEIQWRKNKDFPYGMHDSCSCRIGRANAKFYRCSAWHLVTVLLFCDGSQAGGTASWVTWSRATPTSISAAAMKTIRSCWSSSTTRLGRGGGRRR